MDRQTTGSEKRCIDRWTGFKLNGGLGSCYEFELAARKRFP